ncbi:MAG TPA: hypothetical protein VJA44_02115 [Acidimicrobiia bacterium]|nr:hypothetical protein [Acidimicrobiia bacterium]
MNRRRSWMIVAGLALAAGVALLQLTRWALAPAPAVLASLIGLVVAAYGVRPIGSRTKTHSTREGSSMDYRKELQGWEPVGSSGHFRGISMPMSDEARRLNGGGFRHLLYAEFDTEYEAAAWKEFVYDPLKVLVAEGIVSETPVEAHPHLHVTIYKLTGAKAGDDGYIAEVRERGRRAAELYLNTEVSASARQTWHVGTAVVNHEQPLNPRIGMAMVLM